MENPNSDKNVPNLIDDYQVIIIRLEYWSMVIIIVVQSFNIPLTKRKY